MNSRFYCLVAAMLALAGSGLAESFYLVEVTDLRKQESWEVMNREELSKLQKEIQEESRAFPAALAAAKKAWESDELYKKTPFPGSSLAPRKLVSQGPFTNREQVDKKKEAKDQRKYDAMLKDAKTKTNRNNPADAMRELNIGNALDRLNAELSKALKRDVPQNGP